MKIKKHNPEAEITYTRKIEDKLEMSVNAVMNEDNKGEYICVEDIPKSIRFILGIKDGDK
jgi:hypothetical protein